MAYFDFNATTPLNPLGKQALMEAIESDWANPSSPYSASARVHNNLEQARDSLASGLKLQAEGIVFTGGATEANNAIVEFLASQFSDGKVLGMSPFEHPSVYQAAEVCFSKRVYRIKSNGDGQIDLVDLVKRLEQGEMGAVSLMAVNNETGVIQPWYEASQLCRKAGVLFHCDASQWFGKCDDGDFSACDFLVGCAHKFGGPKGVGFVALSANAYGFHSHLGGDQEAGRRGGTQNVPGILSMLAALEYSEKRLKLMSKQASYRDEFESILQSVLPDLICIGKSAPRVPNTTFLVLPQFENIRWVRKLDLKGFQVSTGSACSTGKTNTSPLLNALGLRGGAGNRTVRISSGAETSHADWLELGQAFREVWEELNESESTSQSEVISV